MFPPKFPFPIPVDPFLIIKVAKKVFELFTNKNEDEERSKEHISNTNATDLEKSEISDITQLNAALTDFKQALELKVNRIEAEILTECESFFDHYSETLEILNEKSGHPSLFKVERYRHKLEKIQASLTGTMHQYMSKRISLDDVECQKILKLLPGELKRRKLDDFEHEVLTEAITELITILKEKMQQIQEELVQVIEDKMDIIEDMIEEKESFYDSLLTNYGNKQQQSEQLKAKLLLKQSAIVYLLNELETE